jgi:hypothetical protein
MAQKFLNKPDICTVFQKIGGKAVAKTMDRGSFLDFGFFNCLGANTLSAAD